MSSGICSGALQRPEGGEGPTSTQFRGSTAAQARHDHAAPHSTQDDAIPSAKTWLRRTNTRGRAKYLQRVSGAYTRRWLRFRMPCLYGVYRTATPSLHRTEWVRHVSAYMIDLSHPSQRAQAACGAGPCHNSASDPEAARATPTHLVSGISVPLGIAIANST